MDNDRELLELAALAAGIDVEWQSAGWAHNYENGCCWNPLTDDGDALRLAAKLKLAVSYPFNEPTVRVWYGDEGQDPIYEDQSPDPYAATRRAITRAAAEIGRSMKATPTADQAT